MTRATALSALLVTLACSACDPPDSVSAEDALEVTCIHARAALAILPGQDVPAAEPHEIAAVLETDARLLRAAGDDATAHLVDRTAEDVEDRIGTAPDLVVYLRDDSSARGRNRLEELAGRLDGVETVRFVPSEESYRRLEADLGGTVTPEVLPDSFEIAAVEGTDLGALRDRLERRRAVDEVELRGKLEALAPVRTLAEVCELPS